MAKRCSHKRRKGSTPDIPIRFALRIIDLTMTKVCGILMEMSDNCLLIGIGCNVLSAPSAAVVARDGGRPPTSLSQHNSQMKAFLLSQPLAQVEDQLPFTEKKNEVAPSLTGEVHGVDPSTDMVASLAEGDFYKVLATEICSSIQRWVVSGDDTSEAVVADFQRNMGYSLQKIRDQQTATGAHVLPLRINPDGTLQVSETIVSYRNVGVLYGTV